MIKRIWSCDLCHTIKSCVVVALIGVAAAGVLIIIRAVGEKRLQHFLMMVLFFKRREPNLDLASEAFAPEKQI